MLKKSDPFKMQNVLGHSLWQVHLIHLLFWSTMSY